MSSTPTLAIGGIDAAARWSLRTRPAAIGRGALALQRHTTRNVVTTINHGTETVSLHTSGLDLLTQEEIRGKLVLTGGGVAAVRRPFSALREKRVAADRP